jgi:pimeloyl-ACP methyl ester carboxylesterase
LGWWSETRLADRFLLIAPDLRGFGGRDQPAGPFGSKDHAALGIELRSSPLPMHLNTI